MLIFHKLLNVPCSVFTIMTHAPLVYVFLLQYVCLLSGAFCFVSCVKSDVSWFNPGQILQLAIPKQISTISMHIPSLVISNNYQSYRLEMKIRTCRGQMTLSKNDEICPSAIPDQISTKEMHIPRFVKIH